MNAGKISRLTVEQANALSPHETALMIAQEWTWPVFPTDPATKRPHAVLGRHERGQGGLHQGTVDAEKILWWNDRAPECAWALDLGRCGPGGLAVLDCEGPRKGHDVLVAIAATKQAHGPNALPETLLWTTPSGGLHAAYRLPPGVVALTRVPDADGVPIDGCEIRRSGMYCLAPTSPGRRWVTLCRPAKAAAWMYAAPPPVREVMPPSPPRFIDGATGTAYGCAALAQELAALLTASNGTRNCSLNTAAYSLARLAAGGHLDVGLVRAALASVAAEIGLEQFEIEKTLDSAISSGLLKPRGPIE